MAWRRRFARFNTLCYRCLSPSHLQRGCPEKKGCTEKNCARPLSHHLLLHLSTTNDVNDDERNTKPSMPPATDLTVHNATMEDSKRSFVLLKVVPLCVISENGAAVTTCGLLDTAAVSSMISSHLAERLKLQGAPEKVSINTVTHKNHDCELSKVRFQIGPTSQDGPCFTVYHAPAVEGLKCDRPILLEPAGSVRMATHVPVDVNEVSVLIGQDLPQAHIVLDYCWGDNPQSQPYAMKTPFGWCVAGPTNRKEDDMKPVALSVFEFDWAEDK